MKKRRGFLITLQILYISLKVHFPQMFVVPKSDREER